MLPKNRNTLLHRQVQTLMNTCSKILGKIENTLSCSAEAQLPSNPRRCSIRIQLPTITLLTQEENKSLVLLRKIELSHNSRSGPKKFEELATTTQLLTGKKQQALLCFTESQIPPQATTRVKGAAPTSRLIKRRPRLADCVEQTSN